MEISAPVNLDTKHRPQRLDQLLGQPVAQQILAPHLETGVPASAYLFAGPSGVGKTTAARIVAMGLNCLDRPGPAPCGECASCKRILRGEHEFVLELNAGADGGIDTIRSLTASLTELVPDGARRVVILDEAHGLTPAATAALLKPLEEPPLRTVIILATTAPAALAPTLRSRCIEVPFSSIPTSVMEQRLVEVAEAEGIELSEAVRQALLKRAQGCMRMALELLGTTAQGEKNWLANTGEAQECAALVLKALASGDLAEAMQQVAHLMAAARDDRDEAFRTLATALYGLHHAALVGRVPEGVVLTTETGELLEIVAKRVSSAQTERWIELLLESWGRAASQLLVDEVVFGLCFSRMLAVPSAPAAQAPPPRPAPAPAAAPPPATGGAPTWEAVLEAAAAKRSLRDHLAHATPAALEPGRVQMAVANSFRRKSLRSRAGELEELLGAAFGGPVAVEVVDG